MNWSNLRSFIVLICLIFAVVYTSNPNDILWPQPMSYTSVASSTPLYTSPCVLNYTIQSTPPSLYPRQLLNYYLTDVFKCPTLSIGAIKVLIVIKNSSVIFTSDTTHEKYQIKINQNSNWQITTDYYAGFTKAIETFSQLFRKNSNIQPQRMYSVLQIPITIVDQPQFYWRGIMIDSSRHYLPVSTILHTIDGMLFNKFNVLHWHIIDEDSFPLEVPTRPQLSQYGSLSGTYTPDDITKIIQYAKVRGIRVIPQIDTPAHTQSWGRSPQLKQIVLDCNGKYQGQFDPTLNLTYEVVTDVMKYIDSLFQDQFVHFGGDQIVESCYDSRPSIKQWMSKNNISNYKALSVYYRKEQRKIFRGISNKNVMYWANEQIDLPVDEDDVIHWWGVSKNVQRIVGRNNRVVLSNYDKTYMDIGFGNWPGGSYGTYLTWREAYTFQPRVPNVNIIGGESCMWSELNTARTQDRKLWVRSSAIGERLWSQQINFQTNMANIAKRLTSQAYRMKRRGFKVSAVSVGLCEKTPEICFDGSH